MLKKLRNNYYSQILAVFNLFSCETPIKFSTTKYSSKIYLDTRYSNINQQEI